MKSLLNGVFLAEQSGQEAAGLAAMANSEGQRAEEAGVGGNFGLDCSVYTAVTV